MERSVLSGSSVFDINMSEIKSDMGCYDTVLRTNGLRQRIEKECWLNTAIVTFGSRPILFGGIRLGGNNLGSGIRPGFGCGLCHFIAVSL